MEQNTGYTLRDIFHVLFKRKWMLVVFFLSTVTTGIAVAHFSEQTVYEATTQILLRPGREHVYDLSLSTAGALRPSMSFQLDEQIARTTAMLTGRFLSEKVVEQLGALQLCREPVGLVPLLRSKFCDPNLDQKTLTDRVVRQVQENVYAARVGDAAMVNLTFFHEDPALAAKVANTLASLYVDRHLGVLKDPRADAFLQDQMAVLGERLSEAEKELEAFKRKNDISSTVKEDREVAVRQLTALQAENAETLSRQAEISSRIAQMKAQIGSMATDPQAITNTRERLIDLERKQSELAMQLGDRNPTLVAVREEIRRTREDLLRNKDGAAYQRLHDDLLRSETELMALRARLAAHGPRLAALKRAVEKLDDVEPEFERLEQRAKSEQQNFQLYSTKSEETRISNAMDDEKLASVKVIDAARTPMDPISSKFRLKILLAVVFGALGGVIIAFVLEFLADRIDTHDRAEHILGVPVLASLPDVQLK